MHALAHAHAHAHARTHARTSRAHTHTHTFEKLITVWMLFPNEYEYPDALYIWRIHST